MDSQKVEMYLMTNAKFFPEEKMLMIREKLEALDDNKFFMVSSLELKDPTTNLLLSIFLGSWGVDRFMLGDTGMGILKLLTGGLCGILTIIDWFKIQKMTKEYNFNKVMTLL